jgi:hypothetical protein
MLALRAGKMRCEKEFAKTKEGFTDVDFTANEAV